MDTEKIYDLHRLTESELRALRSAANRLKDKEINENEASAKFNDILENSIRDRELLAFAKQHVLRIAALFGMGYRLVTVGRDSTGGLLLKTEAGEVDLEKP